MKKSDLLRALQTEIRRHTFDTFVDQSPSIAQGGNGVVTPGSPACRKRLFTMVWIIWQMMSCPPLDKVWDRRCRRLRRRPKITRRPRQKLRWEGCCSGTRFCQDPKT